MRHSPPRQHVTVARGFARGDLIATLAVVVVAFAVLAPVLGQVRRTDTLAESFNNLRVLHQSYDCYARDWSDRQYTAVPDDLGAYGGSCDAYVDDTDCYPSVWLGWNCGPSQLYVFFNHCPVIGFSGCHSANASVNWPIRFDRASTYGTYRLPNARGLHDYAGGRFYDPVFYVSSDTATYEAVEPLLALDCEYAGDGNFTLSSYALSPAAMYHPEVLRAPSLGGFQHPNDLTFGYESPTVSQVLHPALKSRLIEHNWMRNAPDQCHPTFEHPFDSSSPACTAYQFNHGAASRPATLFFDGSVDTIRTGTAEWQDARVREQSGGVDGLWSRDTPFGNDGYFGDFSVDGTNVSHHILTTDGIRGRDRLSANGSSLGSVSRGARR